MLVRRGLAVLSFAGVASWSGLAGAQYFRADPTVHLTGGYIFNRIISDNPSIDPYNQSGPLVTIAPALALTYDTPLVTQKLTLTSTIGVPFASDFSFTGKAPTYSLKLNYTGTIPLDQRTKLSLVGSAMAAPINGFSTLEDPSQTPIDAPPADFSYNFSLNGVETLQHDLSEEVSLTQSTSVLYSFPFNVDPIRPSTLLVKNSFAVSRKWTRDTLTLTGSVGVTRFGPGEVSGGPPSDVRVQILNDLTLMWKRPFTESLSGSVHVGVGQTISPESGVAPVWQPTGGAQLAYSLTPATITLAYSYAALVDVYTATTNLNNNVSLRVTLPIGSKRTGLLLAASTGYVHTVPIASAGIGPSSGFNSFTSDAGLTFAPPAVPKLSFSLRGLFSRQVPTALPIDGVTRYGLIFNVGFSYPNTKAVDATSRLAPAFVPSASFDGEVVLGQETPEVDAVPPADAPTDAPAPAPAPAAPLTTP